MKDDALYARQDEGRRPLEECCWAAPQPNLLFDLFYLFDEAASGAWANMFCAALLGDFDGQDWPGAFWTLLCDRLIPQGIFAIRITRTGEENFPAPRFAFHNLALMAFRTFHTGISGFIQRLDMLALRIIAAANEFAKAAVLNFQITTAIRALTTFN